jgi:hypothetical protein
MSGNNKDHFENSIQRPYFSPGELAFGPQLASAAQIPSQIQNDAPDLFDFALHYCGRGEGNVRQILDSVANDILSYKYLHDWDEDLTPNAVKILATFAKETLARARLDTASYMVNFNTVNEVYTAGGVNYRRPALRNPSDVTSQLFPTVCISFNSTMMSKIDGIYSEIKSAFC